MEKACHFESSKKWEPWFSTEAFLFSQLSQLSHLTDATPSPHITQMGGRGGGGCLTAYVSTD